MSTRNLSEKSITGAVIQRMKKAKSPRFKQIMGSLVNHLHDFAREVELTEDEWENAIGFLTRTGQKSDDKRQEFILLSDTLGLSTLVTQLNHRSERAQTEQTVFGPFHRLNAPKFDQWGDISKGFRGKRCYVDITVKDEHGDPVRGAVVDVWHSDDVGFYDVQMKRLNGKMGLRGVLKPDAEGHVRFKTIVPKYYPVPIDGPVGELLKASARHPMRPAHIHFLVQASGYDRLVTHVFVKGDKFIDSDAVFGVRDALVRDYKKHPAGRAPDGTISKTPFYTMTYSFVMRPQPKKTKSSAKSAQSSSPRKSAKK